MDPQTHKNGGIPQFTLARLPNVKATPGWNAGPPGQLDILMADQLMMAISFVKPSRRLVLRCPAERDYHIGAMVRVMRVDGMKVKLVTQGKVRVVTVGV